MNRSDRVRLTFNGRTVRAMVLLASDNGRSLMLGFDGALRAKGDNVYLGAMPVLQDDAGVYRDLCGNDVVLIERDNAATGHSE